MRRGTSVKRVARDATAIGADAIELLSPADWGVRMLRELLAELKALRRPDISIVVHRIG